MKNDQPQISAPITGMNRDSHPSRLQNNTYTFAKNISLEDSSGNGLPMAQNEPSNLLCQNFSEVFEEKGIGTHTDYKIVGFRYNASMGRTYIFFVNTNSESEFHRTSVIGYFNKHVIDFVSDDTETDCNCVTLRVLDEPLENQEQSSLCDFKIVVQDSCNKCLNFSIDNPIFERNIRFKSEQCGRRMYWTDRNNPPRYIDLDLIENPNPEENIYTHTGQTVCGIDLGVEEVCFDCEKIKMIPDYDIPCILPTNVGLGGNLKLGTYEFLIAYCDEEGNELSNYFSHTNPVDIFDYNNVTMDQTEIDRVTGYAIELKASNLDEDFHFYKVAVIQNTTSTGEESYFVEGIHPITDKTILYVSEKNKQRTTLNNLLIRRVKVESVEHMIDSNGYLFMAGIKNKPVLNLQPIVNLMGPYFKWNSVIATEEFYKNGINSSLHRSYMRDEVYPLSLTFGMKDGSETNDFILINRAPQTFKNGSSTYGDLDLVKKYGPTNLNYLSIQKGKNICGGNERIYRWQYENTAQLMGESALLPRCTTLEEKLDYIEELEAEGVFKKRDIKTCSIFDLLNEEGEDVGEATNFNIRIGGDYRSNISFSDYIKRWISRYQDPEDELYSPIVSNLFNEDIFSEYKCSTSTSCNCLDEEEPIEEWMDLFKVDVDESTKVSVFEQEINIKDLNFIETQFPEGIRDIDYNLTSKFVKTGFGNIQARPKRLYGNSCEESVQLPVLEDITIEESEGVLIPVIGTKNPVAPIERLTYPQFNSTPLERINYPIKLTFNSGEDITRQDGTKCRAATETWFLVRGESFFSDKINKSALWLDTQDISTLPYVQVSTYSTSVKNMLIDGEVSASGSDSLSKEEDVAYNRMKKIRVSIYDKCAKTTDTPLTPLKVLFLDSEQDHLLNLQTELGLTTGEFKIAIDTPIIQLKQYEINLQRWFDKRSVGYTNGGMIVPEHYRLYSKVWKKIPGITEPVELYEFYNINKWGQAGVPEGDNDCSGSSIAFNEAQFYGYNFPTPDGTVDPQYKYVDGDSYITAGTDYSFFVTQRGEEVKYNTYNVDSLKVYKVQEYQRECYYENLEQKVCETTPFEEGMFSYWESVEQYPDNEELFNSHRLNFTEEDLQEIIDQHVENIDEFEDRVFPSNTESIVDVFKKNFSSPVEFLYEPKTNFTCKPIRHFKFPSNEISPFLHTNETLDYQNTFIFPIGVSIDKNIINIFLDLAVKTGLITQIQRDSITYFKVKRGDRTFEKSILSKGLLTDVIKYKDLDGDRYFPNFPFNPLGKKELLSGSGYNLTHQYNGAYNNKFVFNSPEVDLGAIRNPSEISIEGFQSGVSEGQVDEVKDHPKMVLLSDSAIRTANDLARTESMFEVLVQIADLGIGAAQASSGGGFSGISGAVAGAVAGGLVGAVSALRAPMVANRTAEFRNRWIEIFKNQGIGSNFAHYITSVGHYNNYSTNVNNTSKLRRVEKAVLMDEGVYNINEPVNDGFLKVNNTDRERSLFIYLGNEAKKDGLIYSKEFSSIDNSNEEPGATSIKETFENRIANLYTAIKVWKPAQYGELGNIKWIDITGCNFLNDYNMKDYPNGIQNFDTYEGLPSQGDMDTIYLLTDGTKYFWDGEQYRHFERSNSIFFGGDTFISKYAYKRKFSYFLSTAMGQAAYTPFKYSMYYNIGRSKYFIDYETEDSKYGRSVITTPSSNWKLGPQVLYEDFKGTEKGNYITNGWMYLYQYGIPHFFVESTINCFNRYAGKEPWQNFYPNMGDYMAWTQENLVSIRRPNTFNYNFNYSKSGTPKFNNFLPNNFVSKFYNCTNNSPNGIMNSLGDVSEKQKVDPWLVYKNFDFDNFPTSNGKLIDLVNIESTQILGIFENQNSIFNAIDVLKERVSPETKELGTGGIFAQRPMDSHRTDNGYGGTQHRATVSTEFGHFWVDARRGHVHQKETGGGGQIEVTQGLRNWFQEHLPFKLLKGKIDGLTDLDLDNPFKNLGISLGWDSRYKRLFLTKLDYKVKPEFVGKLEYVSREGFEEVDVNLDFLSTNKYFRDKETQEEVFLDNTVIFEPAHFTVAYSPIFKTWVSYYDFTPGFYINYDNYFSTGFNSISGPSVWAHLLTNKSFGVFYGKKYPWKIELPTKNQYIQKSLSNIEYWMDSFRYHNNYDFALNTKLGLDKALIYNNSVSSGDLNLVTKELNNRYQESQYPKFNGITSDILVSYEEGKWSFNDFYNRTANLNSNVPLWNYDINAIEKYPNIKALTHQQRWLDRLTGDWFLVRFEGGSDTRYKQVFKWLDVKENILY